jgi:hypothetical protein
MIIRPARWLLLSALPLLLPTAVAAADHPVWEDFKNLVLPLSDTDGVTLHIRTDLGVVAPRYKEFPPDNEKWLNHLTGRVPAAKQSLAAVVARTGWGHVTPYLYAAIYHALGRIYSGISSNPVMADGTPIIPKGRLRRGEIVVLVYGDQAEYNRAARAFGSPTAFYEKEDRRLSLCIPRGWFESLSSLQNWKYEQFDGALLAMEEYLNWLVLRLISHEISHEIQYGTDSPAYTHDLVREGTAMFLMDNVVEREELVKLSEVSSRLIVKPDEATFEACNRLMEDVPMAGASAWGLSRIREAVRFLRAHPTFSLTALLRNDAFLFGDGAAIAERYPVAYLATRFLTKAGPGLIASWKRLIGPGADPAFAADAQAIDKAFRSFAEGWAAMAWENPRAGEFWDKARKYQTSCLNGGILLPAFQAGLAMIAYNPTEPLGWLYTGDVFWRMGKAFIALDAYYAPLQGTLSPGDPMAVLVRSRIADSYELLGRISDARQGYLEVARMSWPPNLAVTVLRGRLKSDYYTLTKRDDTWGTDASFLKLNGYVRLFQAPDAVQPSLCNDGADFSCMAGQWQKRYTEVLTRMKAELATPATTPK